MINTMIKNTARLIITMDCNRGCISCCNKTDPSVKSAEHIKDLAILKDYPYICITGGEPMLNPTRTLDIIKQLKQQNKDVIIYLYTAKHIAYLYVIIKYIDGIHYTLHYPCKFNDVTILARFQEMIRLNRCKSYRLYIDNRVNINFLIQPDLWHRIEIKPWMKECSLPNNEMLFILEND